MVVDKEVNGLYTGIMESRKIVFKKDTHEYSYNGKAMSGITGRISKMLGKDFSKAGIFVEPFTEFGKSVHEEAELYFSEGIKPSHPTARYVTDYIDSTFPRDRYSVYPEVLVGDYEEFATAIDIVVMNAENEAYLFDIKTGVFDRTYCTWQLSINKYFLELEGLVKVAGCYVISTKDTCIYKIFPKDAQRCKKVLYNKETK